MTGCDVVVAGAINTDLVAVVSRAPVAGETVTGRSFSVFGGGKGANQAVAARRSGASVTMVGAIGDDRFGAERKAELVAEEIDVNGVARLHDQQSGVALITVEVGGENRIAYIPGPVLDVSKEQLLRALDRALPKVYLQPNEVPVHVALAAFEHARTLGAVTILNAAPDPENVAPLLEAVDFLIVNRGEAEAMIGTRSDADDLAASVANQTGTSVILTLGGDGVLAIHDGQSIRLPAPGVDVVDTTGAGDTFCGAFAAQLAAGLPFVDALAWAVVAASLATTNEGAQPAIPHAEDIQAFMAARS